MTKNKEEYGFLSPSLKKFLGMTPEQRDKKYGYDSNKYYGRIVKKTNHAFSDIIMAYERLPEKQQKKINILAESDRLLDYVNGQKIKDTPDQFVQRAKSQLDTIFKTRIKYDELQKLAEPDFDKVKKWLEYLLREPPSEKGAKDRKVYDTDRF